MSVYNLETKTDSRSQISKKVYPDKKIQPLDIPNRGRSRSKFAKDCLVLRCTTKNFKFPVFIRTEKYIAYSRIKKVSLFFLKYIENGEIELRLSLHGVKP